MEFYDLRHVAEAGASPTIRTTGKSVLITIPGHLGDSAGLPPEGKVRVQLGEASKVRMVRISGAADGAWSMIRRRNVVQVFVRELMPGRLSRSRAWPTPWARASST